MSKTVDERVVEMRFENDQFEQGIRQSTQSLEMLRKALRFDDSADSLANIEKTMNNADFSGMASNIQTISNRMSTFGIISEQVIRNVTDGVMNLGKRITSTVMGFIKTGGLNRALNIEQAQFQLEGLGVAWQDVAGDIDYAVKGTRYGLDAAAKAAAQLSASGVQLGDDMKGALRGISGVAAMTNQEYEGIAQIFTTVASNGKLMTMQLRQFSTYGLNVAAALAKEMGTTEQAVNEMVSRGEIDFNTFAKAMDNAFGEHATKANETFTGALANMKAALSRLGAEFYMSALPNLRDMFNAITPIIDAVKKGLAPAFSYLDSVMTAATLHIVNVLGSINLDDLINKIQVFVSQIKNVLIGLSYEQYDPGSNITRTVEGLKAAFEILKKVLSGLFGVIQSLVTALAPLGNAFLNITATVGDFLVWLNQAIEETGALEAVFNAIETVISGVVSSVGNVLEAITGTFADFAQINFKPVGDFGKAVVTDFNPVKVVVDAVKTSFEALGNGLRALTPIFDKIGGVIESAFEKMGQAIASGGLEKVLDTLNSGVITFAIANFMDLGKAGDYLFKMLGRGIAPIKVNLTTLRNTLTAYYTSINAEILLKIAKAVGILAISLVALSLVDGKKLATGLGAISVLFTELVVAMKILTGFMSSIGFFAVLKLNMALTSIAISVAILSGALISLSRLDIKQLGIGLLGLSGAMAVMVAGVAALSKISGKLTVTGMAMIALGIAMNLLAKAVSSLGALDLMTLGKGLGSIAILLAEMALLFGRGKMTAMTMQAAIAMILFGAAMNIFASAVGKIGSFDMATIGKGLAGLAGVMAEIAVFSKLASGGGGNMIALGIGMTAVGAAMLIFANAMGQMSNLGLEGIGKGLLAVGGALTAVTIALRLMPKNTPILGVGLIAVGLALQQVGVALNMLGSMTWEQVGTGLVALGGALAILAVGMMAMQNSMAGAAAMIVVSTAIAILAPQLALLSMLSLPQLGMALLALASALGVFAGMAALVQAMIPAIIGLGAGFSLLGGGMAGIGIGLGGITTALATLAALGGPAVIAITESLKALIALIPFILEQVGEGIVALATAIGNGAEAIGEAILKIGNEILKIIGELGPKAIELVADLVVKLAQTIAQRAPELIQAGMDLIIALLEGIRNNINRIVTLATEIVVEFAGAIGENVPKLVEAGIQMVIDLVNGIAGAIDAHAEELGVAAANLGIAIVNGVVKGLAGFATTIGNKLMEGARAAMNKVKSFLGIASPSKKFRDEVGKQIVRGITVGIDSMNDAPGKALVQVGKSALSTMQKALKINSPSVVFQEEVGRWIAEGITEGIEADDTVEEALKKKADNIVSAFQTALNRSSLLEDIARLNFEVWQQLWPDASDTHYYIEYKRYLNEVAKQAERRFKLAEDELEQTIKVVGRGTDEALEATKKMLEARKTYLEARQAVVDADIEIANKDVVAAQQMRDEAEELTDAQITLAQSQYELWQAMNPDASELEAAKRNVLYFNEQLELQEQKIEFLKEKLQETIAEFGSASKEVVEAQNAYLQAQKKYYDLINNRKNVVTSYKENAGLNDDDKKALEDAKNVIREQESNLADYERILRDLAETNERYSFGWSVDEMDAIARKQSGYNREAYENAKKTQQRIEEAMEKGVSELEKLLNGDYTALVKQFKELGWQYADALGKGFEDTMSDRVIPMMNNALNSVKENLSHATEVDRTHTNSGSSILVGTGGITGIKNPKPVSGASSGGGSSNKIDNSVWKPSNVKPANPNVIVHASTNFNQTNNSPKSLSNSSIYRATSSMFAGITGKVTSAVMGAAVSTALKKVVNA